MPLKKIVKTTTTLLICIILLSSCSRPSDTKIYDNKGNIVQLSQLHGKWIIINYWAPWCPACRAEIPDLNHFYKNNPDKDVLLYGVDAGDNNPESQDDAISAAGIEYPVLREDPGSDWQLDQVEAIPTTYILNPEGKVVANILGAVTEKQVTRIIKSLKESNG